MRIFKAIILLTFYSLSAQQKTVKTIYFDFDKHRLNLSEQKTISEFIKTIDTSTIESVQIYGYCDDRGNDHYNYRLSNNRVISVQNFLIQKGFQKKKIVTLEGKGRIIVNANAVEDLEKTRSKNRRVDLIFIKKSRSDKMTQNLFPENLKIGDQINLPNIIFKTGSSKLTPESKKELNKIVQILLDKKTIEFEIRGHVCCTPQQFSDGIDRDTRERKLSWNRAKTVFNYLIARNIRWSRMTYKGYGNKFPLGKGSANDRRVEFLITKI